MSEATKKTAATEKGFRPYEVTKGRLTRLGVFLVAVAFLGFTGYKWYFGWDDILKFVWELFGSTFVASPAFAGTVRWGGIFLLMAIGGLMAYKYVFVRKSSSEFLIRTDGELHKVNWPKVAPWLRGDTEAWGATYVVILVCVFLATYIFAIDYLLKLLANVAFYAK